jgi:hypothetical protein
MAPLALVVSVVGAIIDKSSAWSVAGLVFSGFMCMGVALLMVL